MFCIYFFQTAGLQCGQRGRRRPSVNTHFSPYFNLYVCVCARAWGCMYACQCASWLLSCLCLWPWFLRWRTPGHILPSHLPLHRLCVPRLAVLTGGVATVMDDCALSFSVRVLHLCYLPCGSLSKTSCQVSYTLPPRPPSFLSSSSSSSCSSLISPLFSSLVGPISKAGEKCKIFQK